ncbi:interleukin-12 subunit alpha [Acanthochromis polyacanthus]|uniref:interleukin-12 subunit alpha n=1 Tax=Acanthochromis polyacanthus TaxID=80966 RepID=UPI000B8F6112|nr:interleukin-12 subunit alpha [Acanthochromis polyacanthus]
MCFLSSFFLSDSTPALLLLVLTCSVWQLSQSLPVKGKEPITDSCVLHAQTLLRSITEVLRNSTDAQRNLFSGIDCMAQNMVLNMETNTPSVCSPEGSTCSGITKLEFDQDSCMTDMKKDLNHYYKFLAAHSDSLLGQTVLPSLRELMENCFQLPLPGDIKEAAADRASTYDERLNLCKVLKGFQVRTITINRVIGYMKSDEHTK